MLERTDLIAALDAVGVRRGGVLLVQSDLLQIGPVAGISRRDDILRFYYDALREVLGPEGTLVVLTAYEDYARHGLSFDRRHSPSLSGVFSEFVRTQQGAVRSCHPIVSLTAVGPAAEELCGGAHASGFGWDSPWGRLHRVDAGLLSLGHGARFDGMTFLHYLEACFGVPYQYIKVFDYPVLDDGVPVSDTVTMHVRYLDFDVEYDQSMFKQRMVARGRAVLHPLGRGALLHTTASQACEELALALRENPYALLAAPPKFRRGEIPYDVKV